MRILLSAARECKGYTVDEAAEHCEVAVSEMKEFETSPGNMTASIAIKLRELYEIPLDYISF